MGKSGLIIGVVSLILVLGASLIATPLCAPCLGVLLGIAAGYIAGVFDKPADSGRSMRRGAGAGAIAAIFGLVGGFVGAAINGALLNPANIQSFFDQVFGYSDFVISQPLIWASQLGTAFCAGLFNIAWMAILGLAGGALWFSINGSNRTSAMLPPQEPLPPVV